MSLATFCDLVWTEIWDDCSPMSDQHQYRRIMKELFLDGTDPYDIWYEDAKGKKQRLSKDRPGQKISKSAMDQAREWQRMALEARQADPE